MKHLARPTLRLRLTRCAAGGLAALAMAATAHAAPPPLRFTFEQLIAETAPEYHAYVERLERERLIERGSATARRVERIFRQLLPEAMRLSRYSSEFRWQAIVLKDAEGNFALPDGRIFVSAAWARHGRLSDNELALLIAHEMAHVVANHMLERVSALAAQHPAGSPSILALLRQSREQPQAVRDIAPLMRMQETQADRMGAAILGASGVPLAAAVRLFDSMARAEKRSIGMAFLDTHDTALRRKADLLEWAFSMDWPAWLQP